MPLPFPAPGQSPDVSPRPLQPRPNSGGLKRKAVAIVVTVLGLLLICVVLFGVPKMQLKPRELHHEAEAIPGRSGSAEALKGLQDSYDALFKKTPTVAQDTQAGTTESTQTRPKETSRRAEKPELTDAQKAAIAARDAGQGFWQAPKASQATLVAPPYVEAGTSAAQPEGKAPASDRQQAFLDRAAQLQPTQVADRLHTPESPYMILAGDMIPAVLETGIESDLPGHLRARVSLDVWDSVTGRVLLVPHGTILLGLYNHEVIYGQSRVLVAWQRLRLPNGQTIQLEGMPGVDLSGYAGLQGKVNNHLWPLFRGVLLSSVLSIGSRVPFGNTTGYNRTLPQEFASDFGSAANQAGQQIVQRELQRQPTIAIKPGAQFQVFVIKDVVLQPYTARNVARRSP